MYYWNSLEILEIISDGAVVIHTLRLFSRYNKGWWVSVTEDTTTKWRLKEGTNTFALLRNLQTFYNKGSDFSLHVNVRTNQQSEAKLFTCVIQVLLWHMTNKTDQIKTDTNRPIRTENTSLQNQHNIYRCAGIRKRVFEYKSNVT